MHNLFKLLDLKHFILRARHSVFNFICRDVRFFDSLIDSILTPESIEIIIGISCKPSRLAVFLESRFWLSFFLFSKSTIKKLPILSVHCVFTIIFHKELIPESDSITPAVCEIAHPYCTL